MNTTFVSFRVWFKLLEANVKLENILTLRSRDLNITTTTALHIFYKLLILQVAVVCN